MTGELDTRTVKLMKQPRCGVKDDVGRNMGSGRSKRFALQGSRWKVNTLLYKISKYPTNTDMSRSDFLLVAVTVSPKPQKSLNIILTQE